MNEWAGIGSATDLVLPIYLNQDHAFSLLAQLEDGFSNLHTLKTSTSEAETTKVGGAASIGVSNVFALLGVNLSGERSRDQATGGGKEVTEERVHTPTSLFSKLRSAMMERDFVRPVTTADELGEVRSGDFVEFRARLEASPLVETLTWLKRVTAFSTPGNTGGGDKSGGASRNKSPSSTQRSDQDLVRFLDSLLKDLTDGEIVEVVGSLLGIPSARAVLSSRLDFFVGRSPAEITDGDYRVLGQVTRVVPRGSGDTINLLRRTSFGALSGEKLDELLSGFRGFEELGFNLPELYTEIDGPALKLMPVAIFV